MHSGGTPTAGNDVEGVMPGDPVEHDSTTPLVSAAKGPGAEAGAPGPPDYPPLLATQPLRLCAVVILFLCCVVASGPVVSYPSIEPFLVEYGVFNGTSQQRDLELIYDTGTGIGVGSLFPAGVLFDWLGAQVFVSAGAAIAGGGLMAMYYTLHNPASSWIMYIGYPVAYAGSIINSFALYGWIWMYPEHRALVMALANGSQQLSDTAPYFMGLLDASGALPFDKAILLLAIGAFVVMIVAPMITPTVKLQMQAASYSTGQHVPTPGRPNVILICKRIWRTFKLHLTPNVLYLLWAFITYVTILLYINGIYFRFTALFGKDSAANMVESFALVYGLTGMFSSLVLGRVCDRIGLEKFFFLMNMLLGTSYVMTLGQSKTMCWAAVVVLTFGLSCFLVVLARYANAYAAPDLFGSYFGAQFSLVGLVNWALGGALATMVADIEGDIAYTGPNIVGGGLATLIGLALSMYWRKDPIPESGTVRL